MPATAADCQALNFNLSLQLCLESDALLLARLNLLTVKLALDSSCQDSEPIVSKKSLAIPFMLGTLNPCTCAVAVMA